MIEILVTKKGLEISRFLPNVKCQDALIVGNLLDMEKDVRVAQN